MQSNTRWSLGYVALQVLSQVMKQAIPCVLLLLKCIFFSCNLFSDDPAVLPGSCWLRRFQQLGLILQLLMQGQSYLVPCKCFPYCYQNVYAATQFNLLRQNCLSADKKQPGLLCCCNPNPRSPKSWASPRIKPCSTQAERNLWLGRSKCSALGPCHCVYWCAHTSLSGWLSYKTKSLCFSSLASRVILQLFQLWLLTLPDPGKNSSQSSLLVCLAGSLVVNSVRTSVSTANSSAPVYPSVLKVVGRSIYSTVYCIMWVSVTPDYLLRRQVTTEFFQNLYNTFWKYLHGLYPGQHSLAYTCCHFFHFTINAPSSKVLSCLRIAYSMFSPGWGMLGMVLQLFLCRRILCQKSREFCLGMPCC